MACRVFFKEYQTLKDLHSLELLANSYMEAAEENSFDSIKFLEYFNEDLQFDRLLYIKNSFEIYLPHTFRKMILFQSLENCIK